MIAERDIAPRQWSPTNAPSASVQRDDTAARACIECAGRLAVHLGQPWAPVLETLRRAAALIGEDLALDLLAEVDQIEAAGGLIARSRGRRLTRLAVYYQQLRQVLSDQEAWSVFRPGEVEWPHHRRPVLLLPVARPNLRASAPAREEGAA